MAETVYVLCALTSFACAALLTRAFLRTRTKLLLWSSICFVGMTVNNVLLTLDLMVTKDIDLSLPRALSALVSVLALLVGLIWSSR